jgi:FtsZ-interacting cell division protein ZipA
MEDLVYIVLGIIWLIISVLGGLKKKKAQQQANYPQPQAKPYQEPTVEPDDEKIEIEDMLEEFFGTNTASKKKQPEPTYQQEEYTYQQDEPTYKQEEYSFERQEMKHQSYETLEPHDPPKYETKYAIGSDYEFSAEGHIDTMEDIIRQYQMNDELAQEEDAKLAVEDIDNQIIVAEAFDFDARKAVIYAEIINRKYS